MDDDLLLLPAPRRILRSAGQYTLAGGKLILLQGAEPAALRPIARRIQAALAGLGLRWETAAGPATPPALVGLTLRLGSRPDDAPGTQGYALSIRPEGMAIEAASAAGLFYGVCTLAQIVDQAGPGRAVPCLEIIDWPDFPARGVMLDVSRDKVPSMATLYRLIEMLAGWKINQIQLYTEHTFAYRSHPEVWAAASPITGEEIMDLDAFCRDRFIELVPNQNSFGHLERWLRHPRYLALAEIRGEIMTPWGPFRGPYSLCPSDPGSLDLLREMYDELLPHFSSRMFNVGCDETWDLGQGRSHELCAERGAPQVYLDFLLKIQAEVHVRGHVMQFWADIVNQHPELIPDALRASIALEWGYEADHPFEQHVAGFAQAGVPFYVCPGTSTWCSLAGRTDNALGNLQNAAAHGRRAGAIGYLNTDWGDRGHWQSLPVSYLGFAGGAAYGWSLEGNCDVDMARATSLHAFRDPTGTMGRVAYDLGNVHRAAGVEPQNSSILFGILADPFAKLDTNRHARKLTPAGLDCAEEAIDAAVAPLAHERMAADDAALIRDEFALTERLLRHAVRRGQLWLAGDAPAASRWRYELDQDMQAIIARYQSAWLARNRPGGLATSVARFEAVRADYREA